MNGESALQQAVCKTGLEHHPQRALPESTPPEKPPCSQTEETWKTIQQEKCRKQSSTTTNPKHLHCTAVNLQYCNIKFSLQVRDIKPKEGPRSSAQTSTSPTAVNSTYVPQAGKNKAGDSSAHVSCQVQATHAQDQDPELGPFLRDGAVLTVLLLALYLPLCSLLSPRLLFN